MKLYLSSFRIPTPKDLELLVGKSLDNISVAVITNAKDYYAERARDYKVGQYVEYLTNLGLQVSLVDLREYNEPDNLFETLSKHDLVWLMGGNTYNLRYELMRSGFDNIVVKLLDTGMVLGGDSAGALVVGPVINGVELADIPEFAEEYITTGLGLIPYAILPHVDNPEFANIMPVFKDLHKDLKIIELKDSQAAVFNNSGYKITTGNEND